VSTVFCDYPVCAGLIVEWITDCIRYMREKGFKRIAPTPQAEEAWVAHANELARRTLLTDRDNPGCSQPLWGTAMVTIMKMIARAVYVSIVDPDTAPAHTVMTIELGGTPLKNARVKDLAVLSAAKNPHLVARDGESGGLSRR
jgi:hypothetical protein